MRSRHVTLTWLVVLAAMLCSAPAAAIAGGPSAGDNQYTDPLTGSQNGSGSSHTSTGGTPQTPAPAPAPTASSSSGTSTTPLSSSPPASGTSSPTAAVATASANSSSTLPRTGFDAWLAAAIGVGMIGTGLVTRRRIRCSDR